MTDIHAEPLLEHIPRQTQVQSDYAADYDSLPAHPQARSSSQTNVGQMERMASVIAGGLVFAYGVRQRGTFGLSLIAAGGGLIYRGVTGPARLMRLPGSVRQERTIRTDISSLKRKRRSRRP